MLRIEKLHVRWMVSNRFQIKTRFPYSSRCLLQFRRDLVHGQNSGRDLILLLPEEPQEVASMDEIAHGFVVLFSDCCEKHVALSTDPYRQTRLV